MHCISEAMTVTQIVLLLHCANHTIQSAHKKNNVSVPMSVAASSRSSLSPFTNHLLPRSTSLANQTSIMLLANHWKQHQHSQSMKKEKLQIQIGWGQRDPSFCVTISTKNIHQSNLHLLSWEKQIRFSGRKERSEMLWWSWRKMQYNSQRKKNLHYDQNGNLGESPSKMACCWNWQRQLLNSSDCI